MNDKSPEPDSRDDDSYICAKWQSDGGSHLEMIVDKSLWSEADITQARTQFRAASDATCQILACQPFHIGVMLCGDARIRELNREFLGRDKPTNVLSFPEGPDGAPVGVPGDSPVGSDDGMSGAAPGIAGQVAMAIETIRAEARDGDIEIGHHLAHLWVHALLHLLGHDHGADDEAERMESLERQILARLGIADPYRDQAADMNAPGGEAPAAARPGLARMAGRLAGDASSRIGFAAAEIAGGGDAGALFATGHGQRTSR